MNDKTLDNIKTILLDLDVKISHIEDMEADNRAIIVKLVKQNNEIVKFLQTLQVDIFEDEELNPIDFINESKNDSDKPKDMHELVAQCKEKSADLAELEKELEQYKDQITPGQAGES